MFGFVAYQLWGTGIEYARAQDRAEDQFERAARRRPSATSTTTGRDDVDRAADATTTLAAGDERSSASTSSTPRRRHARRRRSTTTAPSTTIAPFDVAALDIAGRRGLRPAVRSHGSASTTSSSPASGARTSRRGPGTTRRRRCRASSATRRSPATAPRTADRSSTSTSSSRATRSSSTTPYGEFIYLTTTTEIVDRRRLAGDRHDRPDDGDADADHVPSRGTASAADDRPRRARPDAVRRPRTGGVQLRPRDADRPTPAASCPATTPRRDVDGDDVDDSTTTTTQRSPRRPRRQRPRRRPSTTSTTTSTRRRCRHP